MMDKTPEPQKRKFPADWLIGGELVKVDPITMYYARCYVAMKTKKKMQEPEYWLLHINRMSWFSPLTN